MFDKIVFISDRAATIKLKDSENITMNLMNLHIVFEDETKKVLGEVDDVNGDTVNASFLGEIVNGRFLGGTIRKPRLDAKIRVISDEEIPLITGKDEEGYMPLGKTPFYEGAPVFLDVNHFFSGHFAIMGNSGSGKSCGISRLFQNMFHDKRLNPFNANIIMLDSSGEYYNAFSNLSTINPSYHYRFITTNDKDPSSEKLRIPIYLLNEADLALLLQVTSHSQLPIIERMRKLALVFSQKDVDANDYKNHLIAKAIMTILYTNESGPNKRNEIFSVIASCSTPQFSLDTVVQGIGYTRKFRECFLIDNSGNFSESVLITEYVSSFIDDKLDAYEPNDGVFYTLDTLEKALNFTLISEGWLRNKNTYGDAVTLKVRLHSLIVSDNAKFFDVKEYMTVDKYLASLMNGDGIKYQFVNINLDDVDDDFAKVITKIYSRMIFDYSKGLTDRASMPFHLVVEEAHRYIQNDNDRFLIGYNIFERIAKEGRKYGVILGIITQRPVELSDTVISQCSNFLIFKMNHPVDVEYIRKMVPNISDEIVEKQKTLQAGTCLGFGSAFKIPMIVRMDMPDPEPWSGNCDVVSYWGGGSANHNMVDPNSGPINIASTPVNNDAFSSIPSVVAPTDIPDAVTPDTLVKMNVEDPEVPTMHAGEFGLLAGDTDEEVKMPTTEAGVDLVNLSGLSSATSEVVKTDTSSTGSEMLSMNDSGPSLVNFVDNNSNNTNSEPVNNNSGMNTGLVSFTSTNPSLVDNVGASNDTGANVVNNNVSSAPGVSNVTAAPEINVNMFESTGNGDNEDDEAPSGVNFVNAEPSSLGGNNNSNPSIPNLVSMNNDGPSGPPNLVDMNMGGSGAPNLVDMNVPSEPSSPSLVNFNAPNSNSVPEKSPEQLADQAKLNDTFGKPDFSDLNMNLNMNMNSSNDSFNPMNEINNMNNQKTGNDGFAPMDMNFNNSQPADSGNDAIKFDSGTSLVSFLDQL